MDHRLNVLGGFQLFTADGTRVLVTGKPLALLAYLACAPKRRVARGIGAQLLWGDVSEAHSRASQRQAIFALRHHLGEAVITSDGDWIELTVPLDVDAHHFVRAVEARRYGDAVALYTGDFLPAFAAPGASDFEQWADAERLRLRKTFLAAAMHHLRDLRERGDVEAVLEVSKRLVAAAPDDDAIWRQRFEILSLARRPADLLLEIAAFRAMREHANDSIDGSLARFIEQLEATGVSKRVGDESRVPTEHVVAAPAFQGRTDVFSALLAAVSRTRPESPVQVLVLGEAGLGKTRLLEEFKHRLQLRRSLAVSVRARQAERDDPWALLADLVSGLAALPGAGGMSPSSAALLIRIVPQLADRFSVDPQNQKAIDGIDGAAPMGQAVADLLAAVADESSAQSPLVVLIDDLHWADAPSLTVIERALARVKGVAIVVVCASRAEVPSLGVWSGRYALVPLTIGEVQDLLGSMARLDHSAEFNPTVAALHEASGGVPFAVLRLLRAAMEAGALRIVDGCWVVTDAEQYHTLMRRAAMPTGRLEGVDGVDRTVLMAMALAGCPLEVGVLSRVCDVTDSAVTERLLGLERLGLAARSGDLRWSVAHAIVADDLQDVMPQAELQRMSAVLGAWFAEHVPDLAALRRAVRLQLAGGATHAARTLALRWYSAQRGLALGPEAFADALSGVGGGALFMKALTRSLFWRRRWWSTPFAVASFTLLIAVMVGSAFGLHEARLVNTGTLDPGSDLDPLSLYEVAPRFELLNRLGRVSRSRDGDTVHIGRSRTAEPLQGRTYAVLSGGVAEFDSLYPPVLAVGDSLRVTLSGVPPLGIAPSLRQEALVLEGAVLNGQAVADTAAVVRVRPGERIEGRVRLRYSTVSRGALYVLAQTTTWGDPQRDTITVRSLLAGIVDARTAAQVAVRAPMKPGRYWMLFTHGPEPTAVWLLSATNWRCGRPHWGDGNDLAAQGDSVLTEAVATGAIMLPYRYCGEHPVNGRPNSRQFTESRQLPVSGIRVEVR